MICHPFLVHEEGLVSRNSYRKKRIALSETNKIRFPACMKQENRLMSRLRKGREETSPSFLSQPIFRQASIDAMPCFKA